MKLMKLKILFLLTAAFFQSAFSQNFISATPKPTPKPKATATPKQTPKPTPKPTVAPTPTNETLLMNLKSSIAGILLRPELRRGNIAVKVSNLISEKVIFEQNADKYVIPASNMKSFSVATALEKLTPEYKIITDITAPAKPDSFGIVRAVTIYGRGDVSVSTAFSEGNYYRGLDIIAEKIAQSGVKKIDGDIVADDSFFKGSSIPYGWEWDDLQWFSGAEISALPINDNAVDLFIRAGSEVGAPCSVQIMPANSVFKINNLCVTTAAGTSRAPSVSKTLSTNNVEIGGTMPLGAKDYSNYLTVARPAELFAVLLKQRLEMRGIMVTGSARAVSAAELKMRASGSPVSAFLLAKLESAPLSLIAEKIMKPSQNQYTETLLSILGEDRRMKPAVEGLAAEDLSTKTSAEIGVKVVADFTASIGIPADAYLQHDGSGLSRHNLVSANSLIQLYTYMGKRSRFSSAWRQSLPIGGIDGTIKNRFLNSAATGNVFAKTGTLDQVSALSGYVMTKAGEELVFSIVVNGIPNGKLRTSTIDEIVTNLAAFTGRTQ